MKTTAIASRSAAARSRERTNSQAGELVIYGLGFVACATGLLATASLLAGMFAGGGPLGLALSWITAVFGM